MIDYKYSFLSNNVEYVKITKNISDFFDEKRIFFSNNKNKRLNIGDFILIDKNVELESYSAFLVGNTLPGMGSFSYTWSELPVSMKVGRYCSIAGGLRIHGPRHPIEALTTSPILYDRDFSLIKVAMRDAKIRKKVPVNLKQQVSPAIENDVWIGNNVSISPGVILGTGCIVAAESVVTRNVPPYAIVGGNPAKLIRWRFPEEIREALLETKWWEYSYKDLLKLFPNEPMKFIKNFQKVRNDLEKTSFSRISFNEIKEA